MTPEIIFVFAWPCEAGGACSLVTHKSERQRRQAWNNGKKWFLKENSSVFMVLYFLLQFIWIRRSSTHYSLWPREVMCYKISNLYWPKQWHFLIFWVFICTWFLTFSSLKFEVWWTGFFPSLKWIFLPAVACKI